MARVMPTQVVQTIDELFPHASKYSTAEINAGQAPYLLGLLNLLKDVPDELIMLSSAEYADLVFARSAIEDTLQVWRSRGNVGVAPYLKGDDVVSVIRRALVKCPDEIPPSGETELLFVTDPALRDNIRSDLGAVNRALNNAEWKAATVLAGAAIEALLHWRLQKQSADAQAAVNKRSKPLDRWELHDFIETAEELKFLSSDTCSATRLAKNFRNLIHPGRAARLNQTCDRGTALSAVGALERVIEDLRKEALGVGTLTAVPSAADHSKSN
jgi:hypothetical protein